MRVLIIDGQGGGIGKALTERLKGALPDAELIAVGTNASATAAMVKGGADVGATGENALLFNCGKADVIAGPIGIVMANAMYGEISPTMAAAVTSSDAQKILIPVSKCMARVVGVENAPLGKYIDEAVEIIKKAAC